MASRLKGKLLETTTPGETSTGATVAKPSLQGIFEAELARRRAERREAICAMLGSGTAMIRPTVSDDGTSFTATVGPRIVTKDSPAPIDITDMLQPGSSVLRCRPDGDDVSWNIHGISLPTRAGASPRLVIEHDGRRTNIATGELLQPDGNGRMWTLPAPAE